MAENIKPVLYSNQIANVHYIRDKRAYSGHYLEVAQQQYIHHKYTSSVCTMVTGTAVAVRVFVVVYRVFAKVRFFLFTSPPTINTEGKNCGIFLKKWG